MAKITAPNRDFNGVSAGVVFENGVGETDDKNALAYFRRKGYGIGNRAPQLVGEAGPEIADPRKVAQTRQGTPVRDAAVNPRKGDFLAPTNAGKSNPHGPDVVSPQVHASQGVRPVKGGDVHVDDPTQQSAAETGHTEDITDGTPIDGLTVPEGDLAAQLEWIGEAETQEESRARAVAVYAQQREAGTSDEDLDALGERLRDLVYPKAKAEPPAGNASTEAWREYALSVVDDDPEVHERINGMSRDELRDTYGPQA